MQMYVWYIFVNEFEKDAHHSNVMNTSFIHIAAVTEDCHSELTRYEYMLFFLKDIKEFLRILF